MSSTRIAPRHFPGVNLVDTRTGGFYVHIISGMVGDGEPLYIIDGTQMHVDRSRGIDWVKPEDVLSIKVLKDPVDVAVYGTQGRNGVILMSTRLGVRARDF